MENETIDPQEKHIIRSSQHYQNNSSGFRCNRLKIGTKFKIIKESTFLFLYYFMLLQLVLKPYLSIYICTPHYIISPYRIGAFAGRKHLNVFIASSVTKGLEDKEQIN